MCWWPEKREDVGRTWGTHGRPHPRLERGQCCFGMRSAVETKDPLTRGEPGAQRQLQCFPSPAPGLDQPRDDEQESVSLGCAQATNTVQVWGSGRFALSGRGPEEAVRPESLEKCIRC